MKTFKYSLSIFLLTALSVSGQIIYDFQKGDFVPNGFIVNGKIQPIKMGDFVVFQIKNINTFRFKGEIQGRSIDYVTQMPSELQVLFRQPNQFTDKKNTTEGLKEAEEAVEKMKVELTNATAKSEKKK